MKDFDEIKDLWNGQRNGPAVKPEDIVRDVKRLNRKLSNKMLIEASVMLAGVILFGWIWFSFSFLMWTTHLALAILITCCLYYVTVQFIDYRNLSNSDHILQKPDQYISYLTGYRNRRYKLNTRNYRNYSLFIGLALLFYSIEVYYFSPLWHIILGIVFTAAWFAMCWKLMVIYTKREQERLYAMIVKLKKLKDQFN